MNKIKMTALKTKCTSHLWILSFWCNKSVTKINLIENEQSRFLLKIIWTLVPITETLCIQFALGCSSCISKRIIYLINSDNNNNGIY